MLKLSKIAVTGGLASGKTTVCRMFEESGAYVVSADEIVHQLLSLNTSVGQQVVSLLGSDIVKDGFINRKIISEKVFSQPDKLKALEKIIHPAVFDEIEKHYQKTKKSKNTDFFVAEIPLFYESESKYSFDYVLSVVSDPALCRERFIQKGHSAEEYERRMMLQYSPTEKAAKANFTITNNGDLKELKNQVYSLLKELRSR